MFNNDFIKYIHEFIVLTEVGNYLYASEELFISESNLSRHIKSLEQDLGYELFRRSPRKLELTDYGQMFLEYARRFDALNAEFRQAHLDYENQAASTVKLAVAHSMNCDHIVNMLSDHFWEHYPQYHISTGEFSRTVSLEQTFAMGYELVFALDDKPTSDEYFCYPWATDHLLAILPLNHPLAKETSLNLSMLSKDTFLLFPEKTFLYRVSRDLCEKAGFVPKVDFTIHGTSNLAALVSEGVGVSLTTSSDILAVNHHDVSMVKIDPSPLVYLNLYYRKNHPLSKVAKTFLDFAIDIHKNHSGDIPYMGPEGEIGNIYF